MRKWGRVKRRVKHRVDYRHRWPTQQTLIESRVSVGPSIFKRRWKKSGIEWVRRLKRRSSPEPGKSTHPYDTGVGEQGSDSGSSSTSTGDACGDGLGFWKLFTRMSPTPPPPAPPLPTTPIPKFSHIKDETRSETPKTPVQYLRLRTSSRKSPFPRSRTATPSDFDRATVKSTRSRIQTPALPPMASPPEVESSKTLLDRFENFAKNTFRLRSLGWACS
ncbi:hypothetical protein F4801DRAFT_598831 [Xylaria longipes]|nr:hypothetical protein F4801DRAFT_598831 [Xylaria longipes]